MAFTTTDIIFDEEAREKLLKGVNKMAKAVGSTLGPRGTNVAIARATPQGEVYERLVIHDGVGVARSIELEDEFENMGAQLLKQASQKQVDMVGDGTTVTMILAQAIIKECLKMISTGINPMELRRGLEDGRDKILNRLDKLAIPLKTYDEMVHIATISAEDDYLGKLVADTLKKVGKDGVVDVVESKSPDTSVDYQKGMQINKGWVHELFVTNVDRMEAVFENPQILITDKSITSLVPLTKILTALTSDKIRRPLVIIAPDISGEALPLLAQNKMKGLLYTLCIKAPSFGQDQKGILQDIAILTGAKFITEDAGHQFEDITVDDLGEAGFVTATKNETIISNGYGSKKNIESRIASIRKQIKDQEGSEFDQTRLKSRLGKLTSGIAVISVGGVTEVEMRERRERLIDSVAALRAAMDKGIVPGGEVVYLSCIDELKDTLGEKILKNALKTPFNKLVENAGYDAGELLAKRGQTPRVLSTNKDNIIGGIKYGFDVTDGKFKDMVKSGIVDPVQVATEAIKNSVSVAIQIVSTGTIITPIKQDKK